MTRTYCTPNILFTMRVLLFVILAILTSCRPKAGQVASSAPPAEGNSPATNPYYSRSDTTVLHVSDAEWKKILPDSIYQVAREKDTEYAFTGKYWNYTGIGTYYCAVCGNALFRSDSKFASECGWPSFFETVRPNSVAYQDDHSYNMERVEVLCGRCGSHLGHLFDDGPPPTGKRFCMNSVVLDFEPDVLSGGLNQDWQDFKD